MHKDRLLITRKIPYTNNNTLKGHYLSNRKFVLPMKTVIKKECYETVNQAPAISLNFKQVFNGSKNILIWLNI